MEVRWWRGVGIREWKKRKEKGENGKSREWEKERMGKGENGESHIDVR